MASLDGGLAQPTYSEAVLVRAARLLADLGDLRTRATATERAEIIAVLFSEVAPFHPACRPEGRREARPYGTIIRRRTRARRLFLATIRTWPRQVDMTLLESSGRRRR